jgi:hypothetical protein
MTRRQFSRLAGAIFAACTAAACSSGGSGGAANVTGDGSGTLTLSLADAPVRDVSEIWLDITNLSLKPEGDAAAIDFPLDPPLEIDLLKLTPDNAATLLDGVKVPAGNYDWLAMDVNATFDGATDDSHVVTTSGGTEELRVPSGRVRLVSGLTITADQATSFMIDWDARKGLVHPPGQPGYMLRPAFRIVDMTSYGTLNGTVALATIQDESCLADNADDVDVGNSVYVYAGAGVTPDDIDGTDPEPVATVDVKQNDAGDYVFHALLSPGDYTVAFTCQAGNDDPDTDDTDSDPNTMDKVVFSAPTDVTIVAGAEATATF